MNYVINSYENYKEENRLTTNNARKIEFIITTKILDELIPSKCKILDCAAGTGVYAFWLAEKGHDVTATDITPRHVNIMNQTLAKTKHSIHTAVLDATDMSVFEDETFDVVLNMGPFYHLITEEQREKCFWTDTYYSSKEEMEAVYNRHKLKIVDHFAQDGLAPLLHEKVDGWNEEQFKIWCDYHYSICRENSVLGSSNHVVIIGEKFA